MTQNFAKMNKIFMSAIELACGGFIHTSKGHTKGGGGQTSHNVRLPPRTYIYVYVYVYIECTRASASLQAYRRSLLVARACIYIRIENTQIRAESDIYI